MFIKIVQNRHPCPRWTVWYVKLFKTKIRLREIQSLSHLPLNCFACSHSFTSLVELVLILLSQYGLWVSVNSKAGKYWKKWNGRRPRRAPLVYEDIRSFLDLQMLSSIRSLKKWGKWKLNLINSPLPYLHCRMRGHASALLPLMLQLSRFLLRQE